MKIDEVMTHDCNTCGVNEPVAKAARLMYVSDDHGVRAALTKCLQDSDPLVRRCACESLMRRGAR